MEDPRSLHEKKIQAVKKVRDLSRKAQEWKKAQENSLDPLNNGNYATSPKSLSATIIMSLKLNAKAFKIINLILAAIIFVLICTNPSRTDFASFMHWKSNNGLGRDKNYFVCSIYSLGLYKEKPRARYFAILGNFYKVK